MKNNDLSEIEIEKLFYLIFCFLAIPIKTEYFEKFKEKEINSCIKLCEENEKGINDFFTNTSLYVDDKQNIAKYIKFFAEKLEKLQDDNDIYDYHICIADFLDKFIMKLDNKKEELVLYIKDNLPAMQDALKKLKLSNNNAKKELKEIITSINLSLIFVEINIKWEKLNQEQKGLVDFKTDFEKTKNKVNDQIKQMEEEVKRNTPLVQFSTFGTFIVLLIPPIGMLYTASAGFFMLKENVPFYKTLFLLSFVVICILAFIYVMQMIFFKGVGEDKQHISAKKLLFYPFIVILIIIFGIIFGELIIKKCFLD